MQKIDGQLGENWRPRERRSAGRRAFADVLSGALRDHVTTGKHWAAPPRDRGEAASENAFRRKISAKIARNLGQQNFGPDSSAGRLST